MIEIIDVILYTLISATLAFGTFYEYKGSIMQNIRLICLLFICICPGMGFAKISLPKEVVARPSAHCQAPLWSPDGRNLAVDIYNPKKVVVVYKPPKVLRNS